MPLRLLPAPVGRLLGLILVLAFSADLALETRGHGCAGMGDRASEVGAHAHHATADAHAAHGAPTDGHSVPAPSLPSGCDCVSHACCSASVSLATPGLRTLLAEALPVAAPVSGTFGAPGLPAPPHFLPFSLAPPTLLG